MMRQTFEEVGIAYQMQAYRIDWAEEKFKWSCDCCCNTGRILRKSCSSCKIKFYHNMVVANLLDKESESEAK